MAIAGAGAGAAQALQDILVRQLAQQQFEQQMKLRESELNQRALEANELAKYRNKSLEADENARRDRNNAAGLEDMYRQRAIMDQDANNQALDQIAGDQSLPQSVRTVVGLRRRGVAGISPEDVEDPTVLRQRKADDARAVAEANYGTAAKYRAPERQSLSPGQSFQYTRQLRGDFNRETSAAREVTNQLGLMKSALQAARAGDMAAGSQGVLVTFQKILDPTSVVRESEYARSAAGQSLLSRLEGAAAKLAQGGAGVPASELERFVALAEQFARNQTMAAQDAKGQIEAIADEFGLDKSLITRDIGPQQEQEQPQPGAQPARQRIRFDAQGKRIP